MARWIYNKFYLLHDKKKVCQQHTHFRTIDAGYIAFLRFYHILILICIISIF